LGIPAATSEGLGGGFVSGSRLRQDRNNAFDPSSTEAIVFVWAGLDRCPLRVVYSVWRQEIEKWGFNFSVAICHGPEAERLKAIQSNADIVLVNPEGIQWLSRAIAKNQRGFNTLIIDESTKFKSWKGKRTRAICKMAKSFDRRMILTGTPSPNSLEDLFSQIYILDKGKSLGTGITRFRDKYFHKQAGKGFYTYAPKQDAQAKIQDAISGVALRLSAEDHLDMPDLLTHDVWVDLPGDILKRYKRLEREMFLDLQNGGTLTPANGGGKYNYCKQLANGGVYDEDHNAEHLHNAKLEALLDLFEELNGKPLLIPYSFTHDLERARLYSKAFAKAPSIAGGTKARDAERLVNEWNEGLLPVLFVHPKSLSHGINMQAGPGRDIAWLGLSDSLEDYQQLNARIWRQNVTGCVRIHRILATSTVDVAVRDRIDLKQSGQAALLNALNRYREIALQEEIEL
jgi:SNF2 family DNA or RNA helicase